MDQSKQHTHKKTMQMLHLVYLKEKPLLTNSGLSQIEKIDQRESLIYWVYRDA